VEFVVERCAVIGSLQWAQRRSARAADPLQFARCWLVED
jgi:hypothetical protein